MGVCCCLQIIVVMGSVISSTGVLYLSYIMYYAGPGEALGPHGPWPDQSFRPLSNDFNTAKNPRTDE